MSKLKNYLTYQIMRHNYSHPHPPSPLHHSLRFMVHLSDNYVCFDLFFSKSESASRTIK